MLKVSSSVEYRKLYLLTMSAAQVLSVLVATGGVTLVSLFGSDQQV